VKDTLAGAGANKAFLRVVRDRFCQTTRNDSGQRVVNREKRAEKGSFVQIFVLVEERLNNGIE
jgi:hypothetical protein